MAARFSELSLEPVETYKFNQYAAKKAGTVGEKVKLLTNYFRMSVRSMVIYHYNIEIIPIDTRESGDRVQQTKVVKRKKIPKEINFIVFDELWQKNRNVFKNEPVFDGEKNIYTTNSLDLNSYEKNFQVLITESGNCKSTFRVRITTPDESHQIDLTNINKVSSTDFKVSEIQALDIIVKNGPRRFKLNIGMNMFLRTLDSNRQKAIRTYLGENKEMAFGFYQSARMTESGLMLNIDRAAIVFNMGGSLIKIIEKLISEKIRKDFRLNTDRFDDRNKQFVENELKMLKIQVNHIPYLPKFTISRFSKESISRVTFEENCADGNKKRTSVLNYFNRTYANWLQTNKVNLNPYLPCVQVGRDRPKYFPLEVCELIHDQHSTKKLNPNLQGKMTKYAGKQTPDERFNEIKNNLDAVIADSKRDGKNYLEQFGVKIDPNFVEVESRVLQQPNLLYRDNNAFNPGNRGAWDMGRSHKQFNKSEDLGRNWVIINFTHNQYGRFSSGCDSKTINLFAQKLIAKSREMGLPMKDPCCIEYKCPYDGRGTLKRNLFDKFLQKFPELKIMICFIPKLDEIYHELKTVAELQTTNGLVTQCISQANHSKCTHDVFVANVLLKINAKLKGVNVTLDKNCCPKLLRESTMIVGLDVTHPAPADKLSQSIAACVGTYDATFTKYHACVVVQPKPKREIVDLASMMTDLLKRYNVRNKRLPDYIVIYRDGVSEGQFDEVMVKELGKLKESFKLFKNKNKSYEPKIMFLVVQKRNHTRFRYANLSQASRTGNVDPGTVVDKTITSNVLYDFYVVAHQGAIGTSRPIHYYVLYDETMSSADEVQKMTYFLSYLYPRCNRSISVPPPVMYAHLSAKRARSHIYFLDGSDGRSTASSGSGSEYRQLSAAETESMNKKLMVKPNLNGVPYFI